MNMKKIQILIALLALSFAVSAQSDRVKTVETRDSASLVIFDNTGTGYNGTNVQAALEELDFDAGNILYVSTTGDNATGVIGNPHKPYSPLATFDSTQNRLINWYYPGIYNIGSAQTYPYVFAGTGKPFPSYLYAPNSHVKYVGTAGSDYVFRLPGGGQTDSLFRFDIGTLEVVDATFCRTSEGKNAKLIGQVKNIKHLDNITGGDALFVVQSSLIEVDSFTSVSEDFYAEPITNSSNIIKIKKYKSDQRNRTSSRLFSSSAKFNIPADSIRFFLSVDDLELYNTGVFFRTEWSGKEITNSIEEISIENAVVYDTTATASSDTLWTVNRPGGETSGNTLEFIFLSEIDPQSRKNIKEVNIGTLKSDKIISISTPEKSSIYTVNINEGLFGKRRFLNITGLSSDTVVVNINCRNCVCDNSTPISNFNTDLTSQINVSGRFETKRSGNPVIYTTSDLYLTGDVELINDGIMPAIIAGSPVTIYVRGNLYMNSDSLHPNVTFVKLDYGYTNPINAEFESTQIILDSLYSKAVGTATYTAGGALSIGLTDIKITGLTPGIEEKFSVTDSTIIYLGDTAYLAVEYSGTVELSPVALGTYLVEFTPYQNSSALQYGGSDVQIRVDASEQWFLPFGNKAVVQAVPGDEFSIRYRGTSGTPSNLRNLSFTVFRL